MHAFTSFSWTSLSVVLSLCSYGARAVTLDLTDGAALQAAAQSSISNLLSLYEPNREGVFEQASTPWFASGILWDMVFDYSRWTGDEQFNALVTGALANISNGKTADILNGASNALESLSGKWNDDIGWQAIAIQSGAEIYGPKTEMPGIDAPWITVPEKTLWEMYEQEDETCGGGIYWSRNRLDPSRKNWKSAITNWEYTDAAARVYFETKNQTVLDLSIKIHDWLFSSGLVSEDGTLGDGMYGGDAEALKCVVSPNQYSYNYGAALGTSAWLFKATGDQKYLDQGSTILKKGLALFAPDNIVTELCEASVSCNRDQQHFKGILLRNMAYYWRMTKNSQDRQSIQAAISGSLDNMTPYCNDQWVCPGNWSTPATRVAHLYPADLGASSSLLVAALGVFHQMTGDDLIPANQLAAPETTGTNAKADDESSALAAFTASPFFTTLSLLTLVSCTFWAL